MGHLSRALLYVAIPLNALSAGGIFCFPMFSPSLASHLHLTQSQLSTIVLAGMMGQYPFAMLVGMFIDRVGPWACSLLAAILFSTGFGAFSVSISQAARPRELDTGAQYYLLVFFFFLAGLGTVASYFSCLFSASKTWPQSTGLATGVITALFGLSPMFLSLLGTLFFPDPVDGLDAPRYVLFLALFGGLANLFGAFALRAVPQRTIQIVPAATATDGDPTAAPAANSDSETAPLLPRSAPAPHEHSSLFALLIDGDFLLLGFIMLCCMGMSEMVVGNIGTIVASFATNASGASSVTAGSQVRLLSIASTVSRLVTGPTSDFTSPLPIRHESGELHFHPKRSVTRVVFLFTCSLMLLVAFLWMSVGIVSVDGVWVLSALVGAAYGMIWTVVPSMVESVWGSSHAARNFGTISYAPFIGTPIFTFLYATMSDRARDSDSGDPMCRGSKCWRSTFSILAVIMVVNILMTSILWKRWRQVV